MKLRISMEPASSGKSKSDSIIQIQQKNSKLQSLNLDFSLVIYQHALTELNEETDSGL